MTTAWLLIYCLYNVTPQGSKEPLSDYQLTLGAYPTKELCEKVLKKATSDKANLVCLGENVIDKDYLHEFHMKNWM